MLELVLQNYWWPQMSWYIGSYTSTCNLCLWTKPQHCLLYRQLHPLPASVEQWSMASMDFIIELPNTHGYDVIMVVVDRGFHVDQSGDLTHGCLSAGPSDKNRHVGEVGDIHSDASGSAVFSFTDIQLSLNGALIVIGRATAVHAVRLTRFVGIFLNY
ncbi:Superoxide dismutase [Cu-Zn] [Termitomyces sp. J132]|nr:Superoxide dismutase [Cu-Zn] [Termitomyces sp. J132]